MAEQATELQFETAEPASGPSEARCVSCKEALGSHFAVNGQRVCPRCKQQLQAAMNAPHLGGLLRATGLGIVAAAIGAGLYYELAVLTGYELGIISIVVGLLVGFAVRRGARGRGGWRYQALAMFLTYASIATTYLPGVFEAVKKQAPAPAAAQGAAPAVTPAAPSAEGAAPSATTAPASAPAQPSVGALLAGFGFLFLFALALPFLAGLDNFMGLVLIAIALYEAWKVNRGAKLTITGPFDVTTVQSGG